MNRFLKDSANNYTLYIDQGTTFSLDILSTTFTENDIADYTFYGSIKQSSASTITSFTFDITKTITNPQKITLKLPNDVSSLLVKDRYGFDVFYTNDATESFRAFGGIVSVTHNFTSIV